MYVHLIVLQHLIVRLYGLLIVYESLAAHRARVVESSPLHHALKVEHMRRVAFELYHTVFLCKLDKAHSAAAIGVFQKTCELTRLERHLKHSDHCVHQVRVYADINGLSSDGFNRINSPVSACCLLFLSGYLCLQEIPTDLLLVKDVLVYETVVTLLKELLPTARLKLHTRLTSLTDLAWRSSYTLHCYREID